MAQVYAACILHAQLVRVLVIYLHEQKMVVHN